MSGEDREQQGGWGEPEQGRPTAPDPRYGQYGVPDQQPQYGQYGPQDQQPPAQPQYGQYGPHGPQQPQYGQYGQAPAGAPTGWGGPSAPQFHAPSQPGIVPLRPLNLGEMLDGAFRAIRANPRVMFGLSLIVMAVVAVLDAIVLAAMVDQMGAVLTGPMTEEALGTFGLSSAFGLLVTSLFGTLATVILTGLLILSVSQSVLGRVLNLSALWTQARGQMLRLVGQTLLIGLIAFGAMFVLLFVAIALTGGLLVGGGESAWIVLPIILIFVASIVVGAWLGVRLSLAAPALMLERLRVMASIRRSWKLTSGHFWRIFGALAVSIIIVVAATTALSVPTGIITGLVFGGDPLALTPLLISNVISVLISAVTVPFLAAVLALVYVDVRMRKEGLDVELARAAEAG